MLCRKPYVLGTTLPVGCGQCTPCRVNKNRLWTGRQILESYMHENNCFVTLTYNEENYPEDGSVNPDHLKNFLKRLRKNYPPKTLRYYGCGEYGDRTQRPHYHLSLFGASPADQPIIEKAWGKGFVHIGEFNENTARYVAQYVIKKWTQPNKELGDRHPEFARMSNRPGIGATAVSVITDTILTDAGLNEYLSTGDVPIKFSIGKKNYPLGGYLRRKLREEVGVSEEDKQKVLQQWASEKSAEMCSLLTVSIGNKEELSLQKLVERSNLGGIRNVEAKQKLYSQKDKAL